MQCDRTAAAWPSEPPLAVHTHGVASDHSQDQGLSPDDVRALIEEHDTNKDGAIDYKVELAVSRDPTAALSSCSSICTAVPWLTGLVTATAQEFLNMMRGKDPQRMDSGKVAKVRAHSRAAKAKSLLGLFKSISS